MALLKMFTLEGVSLNVLFQSSTMWISCRRKKRLCSKRYLFIIWRIHLNIKKATHVFFKVHTSIMLHPVTVQNIQHRPCNCSPLISTQTKCHHSLRLLLQGLYSTVGEHLIILLPWLKTITEANIYFPWMFYLVMHL